MVNYTSTSGCCGHIHLIISTTTALPQSAVSSGMHRMPRISSQFSSRIMCRVVWIKWIGKLFCTSSQWFLIVPHQLY